MAYKINDACTGCEACIGSCPVEAISAKGGKCEIDADTCIDCAACVPDCPIDAIVEG